MEHTSQQTLAKHATCFKIGSTNSDQLYRFSVIASECIMKVYTSLAHRRSNFLKQLLAQVVTTVKPILKISF